jgi:hypothetical protein
MDLYVYCILWPGDLPNLSFGAYGTLNSKPCDGHRVIQLGVSMTYHIWISI